MQSLPSDQFVLEARRLPNGSQVLISRRKSPRSSVRLDGRAKLSFQTRAEARGGRPKTEITYRCGFCGAYHRATKRPRSDRRPAVAWVMNARVA